MADRIRTLRERIYQIIDFDVTTGSINTYDVVSIVATIASILPLASKQHHTIFSTIEIVATAFFTLDYLLRWMTADLRSGRSGIVPFMRYPFTFNAIIDFVSLLPTYIAINPSLRILRTARLLRMMKVTRAFKTIRYSSSIMLIARVLRRQRDLLLAVSIVACGYVLISALVVFNVEPASFNTFFDAIYWATVSLTAADYDDSFPVTYAGKAITMLSSFLGVTIIALPASIVTAGLMEEMKQGEEDE